MLKTMSFVEAHEFLNDCQHAVIHLKSIFCPAMMEVIHDAVNHYAQTPALQGCDEEADLAALFALALTLEGYNSLKPDFDVTRDLMSAPGKVDQ